MNGGGQVQGRGVCVEGEEPEEEAKNLVSFSASWDLCVLDPD